MSRPWAILTASGPGGWLGRLDPRAKLAWFLCCFALAVALRGPASLGLLALAVLGLAWLGGILRGVAATLGALAGFVALVTALDVVYFGLAGGLLAGLKFALAIAIFATFLQTTPPEELSAGLVRLGVPYTFAFTLAAGARFVPTVAREAGDILDAYRARGVPFEQSPLGRVRTYARILVPLVVSTIARSIRLAEAMEARAFGYSPRRTPLRELRLGRRDWLLLASTAALAALAVAAEML
jgi:energy-coupling factor transport system permease protein